MPNLTSQIVNLAYDYHDTVYKGLNFVARDHRDAQTIAGSNDNPSSLPACGP